LHLVNISIESQSFAKQWKPQLILPFHKKKEKPSVENYRPLSHLVEVGKLTEYIACKQLTDMWLEAAERKELSGVCMIDQSALYNLLSHKMRLRMYNFDDASVARVMSGRKDTMCTD
jgi:hypothetical protein